MYQRKGDDSHKPSLPPFLSCYFFGLFILFFVLVLVRLCGGLSDNAPHRLMHLNVWSQFDAPYKLMHWSQFVYCLGRMRRSDLDEGNLSTWGWALKFQNPHARARLALLFHPHLVQTLSYCCSSIPARPPAPCWP